MTTFEETFEMVAMALFVYAVLDLLVRIRRGINIELRLSSSGP